jgi:hypothetical protein
MLGTWNWGSFCVRRVAWDLMWPEVCCPEADPSERMRSPPLPGCWRSDVEMM